jgi:hypothetical protein
LSKKEVDIMATIHYSFNWQFQVDMPDGSKPMFTNLLDAIAFCNYLKLKYELPQTF